MKEQHIEEIINSLYDLIQDAKNVPLSADKCMLERDKALDMLDEIIARLPGELKQSRAIVESRNEIVTQARREAETVIRQAREEAEKMVTQEAIYQEAQRKCQEMVMQTQVRLADLRRVSNEYMDDALRRTEEAIALSLGEVQDTRAKFRALAEAQEKKSGVTVTQA